MERSVRELTSREICSIIKLARESGIQSLSVGDFSIVFTGAATPNSSQPVLPSSTMLVNSPDGPVPYKPETFTAEQSAELEALKYDEMIEQIKMLDPLRYEQLLADGKIEDVHDE